MKCGMALQLARQAEAGDVPGSRVPNRSDGRVEARSVRGAPGAAWNGYAAHPRSAAAFDPTEFHESARDRLARGGVDCLAGYRALWTRFNLSSIRQLFRSWGCENLRRDKVVRAMVRAEVMRLAIEVTRYSSGGDVI